jgi:hypothetical protein
MGHRLFGDRPVGVVSLVEAPLSRSYARKSLLTKGFVETVIDLVPVMSRLVCRRETWAGSW